jgi:catechol 2,3-dioxygenase-like lactoylglutathione lyase family enzyme
MDRIRPRLDQINIVSANPDASIAFYRRLGVEIAEDGVWRTPSGIHHVNAARHDARSTMQLDIDSIAFARLWNTGWQRVADLRGRVVVGFSLRSRAAVDAVYADMTGAGHTGLHAPYDAFWGARYAVIEDPDGIAVGLMSPTSAKRKSAPPQV